MAPSQCFRLLCNTFGKILTARLIFNAHLFKHSHSGFHGRHTSHQYNFLIEGREQMLRLSFERTKQKNLYGIIYSKETNDCMSANLLRPSSNLFYQTAGKLSVHCLRPAIAKYYGSVQSLPSLYSQTQWVGQRYNYASCVG